MAAIVVREWLNLINRIERGIASAPSGTSFYVGLLTTGLSLSAASTASNAASGEVASSNGYSRQSLGRVFTAATDDTITCNGHGLADTTPVRVLSTGTLPTGLSANTTYYVRDSTTNTFKLAATSGGTAIDITATGSGTHLLRMDSVFDTGSDNRAEAIYDVQSFSASGGDISYQGWFLMAGTTGARGDSSGSTLYCYEYFTGARSITNGTSQPIQLSFYDSNQGTAVGV